MACCASPDGSRRAGNLSGAALTIYCEWFLQGALDQITFSAKLFDLSGLERRYRHLTDGRRALDLIFGVLRHGELDRSDALIVFKTTETTAGFLTSASSKTPVRLAFPLGYRERLFPNLFADADRPA